MSLDIDKLLVDVLDKGSTFHNYSDKVSNPKFKADMDFDLKRRRNEVAKFLKVVDLEASKSNQTARVLQKEGFQGRIPENLIELDFDFSSVKSSEFIQILDGLVFSDGYISKSNFKLGSTFLWYVNAVRGFFEHFNWITRWYAYPDKSGWTDKLSFNVDTYPTRDNPFSMKAYRKWWYPNGKKVIPKDLEISPLMMNAAWCGDGGYMSDNAGMLYTNSFTVEDVDSFILRLNKIVGCKAKRRFKKQTQPVIFFSSDEFQKLLLFMGSKPIIPGFEKKFMMHPDNFRRVPAMVREKSLLINDESSKVKVIQPCEGNVQQVLQDVKDFASLINSDGTFMIHRKTNQSNCFERPQYLPVLKISSTNRELVTAVARNLRLSRIKETTPKYGIAHRFRLTTTGRPVIQFIKKLLPYLNEEKKIVAVILLALPMGRGYHELKHSIYEQFLETSKALQLQRLNEETPLQLKVVGGAPV